MYVLVAKKAFIQLLILFFASSIELPFADAQLLLAVWIGDILFFFIVIFA